MSGAWTLAGLGLLALAAHAALAATAPWSGRPALFLALLAAAASISGLTALSAARLPRGRIAGAGVLAISLAIHALWFFTPPTLSDDVYRYAYEGRLVRAGISPYDEPPRSEALAAFRDSTIWPRINHPELSSVYPPLTLGAFAAGSVVGGVGGQKLVFGLASLATGLVLVLALRRRRRPPALAAAWAWAPLPGLEFAGSAHQDALGILALVAALAWAESGRGARSAVAWALAVGAKGLPAVTALALLPAWRPPARVIAGLGGAALALPLVLLAREEHSGLLAYARRWEHNAILFGPLRRLLEDGDAARLVAGVAVALAALAAHRIRGSLATRALLPLAVALVFSPTLHPWYAAWVLALAPLAGSAGAWALGQTVLLSYAMPGVQESPGFAPVPWGWRAVQWGLPLGLWAWEIGRARAARGRMRGAENRRRT